MLFSSQFRPYVVSTIGLLCSTCACSSILQRMSWATREKCFWVQMRTEQAEIKSSALKPCRAVWCKCLIVGSRLMSAHCLRSPPHAAEADLTGTEPPAYKSENANRLSWKKKQTNKLKKNIWKKSNKTFPDVQVYGAGPQWTEDKILSKSEPQTIKQDKPLFFFLFI